MSEHRKYNLFFGIHARPLSRCGATVRLRASYLLLVGNFNDSVARTECFKPRNQQLNTVEALTRDKRFLLTAVAKRLQRSESGLSIHRTQRRLSSLGEFNEGAPRLKNHHDAGLFVDHTTLGVKYSDRRRNSGVVHACRRC